MDSAQNDSRGGVMTLESVRRSDRVALTLLLEASGQDLNGQDFRDSARTLLINRHGAVIVLDRELAPEQRIHLRRRAPMETHREGEVRVVGQFGKQSEGAVYGIEVLGDQTDLWGVDFPPVAESSEAVARMLLECTYCRGREVVYLNEFELRGFETNRGIARHCKTCGVPSIWIQAQHEDEKKPGSRSRARKGSDSAKASKSVGDAATPTRERPRVRTRLTACIRQADADDELAVCEDISPVGLCFRSKRRYEVNAPIHVAVPYSPDAANIFLPARIVYSEAMPKAGLFRHGTEYRRPTSPAR
jgi:PilZ domain